MLKSIMIAATIISSMFLFGCYLLNKMSELIIYSEDNFFEEHF